MAAAASAAAKGPASELLASSESPQVNPGCICSSSASLLVAARPIDGLNLTCKSVSSEAAQPHTLKISDGPLWALPDLQMHSGAQWSDSA